MEFKGAPTLRPESTVTKVLRRVRDSLSDPAAWLKDRLTNKGNMRSLPVLTGSYDEQARTVLDDPNAPIHQMCLMGAVHKACHDLECHTFENVNTALHHISKAVCTYADEDDAFGKDVTRFNDSDETGHDDVLSVLDIAVRKSENVEQFSL